MSSPSAIFQSQNTWLKLLIFVIALLSGMLAHSRHLLLHLSLFALYFFVQITLYKKLIFAFRKMLPFLAAYWLFATLVGTDFVEMLIFSLRLILLLFCSVYFFGTLHLEALIGDSHFLLRSPFLNRALCFLIATLLFIKNYAKLYSEQQINRKSTLAEIMNNLGRVLTDNLAASPDIEAKTRMLLENPVPKRELVHFSNLLAVFYLCLNMLLYAI